MAPKILRQTSGPSLRHQPGENLDRQEGRILVMGQSGQEVVPFGSWKTRGQLRIRRP